MRKKDGELYCDACGKSFRSIKKKERITYKLTAHYRGKTMHFCNYKCACKKIDLTPPNFHNKSVLPCINDNQMEEIMRRLDYVYATNFYNTLKKNRLYGNSRKAKLLCNILLCDDPHKRRDEFYSLFIFEESADILWKRLMQWYYGYSESDIVDHMWDTMAEIHKAFGITD